MEQVTNRADELLQRSEDQFKLLVEGVQDYAIFMLDPEGYVCTWNIGAERIKGYQASEIIGEHFSCFYPEEDACLGKPARELEIAARDGRYEDEGWRIRKDGTRFWANVTTSSIRDASDQLLGFSKVTRDLTERNRLERELKRERDALRLLLDLNNRFASILDFRQLFDAISAELRSFMQADFVGLSIPQPGTADVKIYSMNFPGGKGFLPEGETFLVENTVSGRVLRTGEPFIYDGLPAWLNPKSRDALVKDGVKSGCTVPLIRNSKVIGSLGVAYRGENGFAHQDVVLLCHIAGQLAIAVENTSEYRQVAESKKRLEKEKFHLEDEIRREGGFGEIIGKSHALKRVLDQVETVARTDAAVLILGETGTGKELIARAIHQLSSRRGHSLVRANCASIPAGLLESALRP